MKIKITLFFAAIIFSTPKIKSQCAIPDAGFENWTVSTYSSTFGPPQVYSYEHLSDSIAWNSFLDLFNMAFGDSLGPCMQKSTDKYSGNYALKVNADTVDYFGLVSGVMVCTTRNQNFNGYYKYNGSAGDTLIISAYLYKTGAHFDGTGDSAIAYSEQIITTAASSYTNFTAPLTYNNGLAPDSAFILIMVLNHSNVDRYVIIDDISFSGTVAGINTPSNENLLLVYPNPAKDNLYIQVPSDVIGGVLNIYDVSGRLMESTQINNISESILLKEFPAGVYSLQIVSENNSIAKRFIKE